MTIVTPEFSNLTRLHDLLAQIPVLDAEDRIAIFTAYDTAPNIETWREVRWINVDHYDRNGYAPTLDEMACGETKPTQGEIILALEDALDLLRNKGEFA